MYAFQHGIIASSIGGGGTAYILDTYGSADFAYSIRKLSSSYSGACLRIRRSSDNAEQDINFVSGYIDTAFMLSFVGVNDGFVVKWYDQSGNVNDSLQTSGAIQPKIISSGSLIVSSVNNRPKISNGGTVNQFLNLTNTVPLGNPFFQVALIDKFNASHDYTTTGGLASVSSSGRLPNSTNAQISNYVTATNFTLSDTTLGEKILTSYRKADLIGGVYLNNSQQDTEKLTSKSTSTSLTRILNINNSQRHSNLQELIFWSQDYTANINDINTEINNYYGIY